MRFPGAGRQTANRSAGFTYLGLLFLVAIIGVGLAAVAQVWRTNSTRDKEAQLLFIGDEFRRAIASYAAASPNAPQYPTSLEQLVRDDRFPNVRRHLRRIYRDPMTGTTEWGLVSTALGINGVYSLSEQAPLKSSGFATPYASFSTAATYQDWKFVYTPVAGGAQAAAPAAAVPPGSALPALADSASAQAREGDGGNQSSSLEPCDAQRADEARACADTAQRVGAEATSRCVRSVAARHAACKRGATLPPLLLSNQ